jgi:hypothetical protein
LRRPILTLSHVVLAIGLPCAVAAQRSVMPGARIRLTMPSVTTTPFVRVVERASGDTIFARTSTGTLSAFPLGQVTRLELSRGVRRPMWSKTALLWMPLAGAGVGAIGGAAKPASRTSRKDSAAFVAIFGGMFGLIAGVVTAIAVPAREAWDTVPSAHR